MAITGHFAVALGGIPKPNLGNKSQILVAVRTSSETSVLEPGRFLDLLRANPTATIVCLGVADFFAAIEDHFRHSGRPDSVRSLYDLASASRIHDIQLFDQLFDLATRGTNADVRSLTELDRSYAVEGVGRLNEGFSK